MLREVMDHLLMLSVHIIIIISLKSITMTSKRK
jgi:hypothetical protein